MARKAAGTVPLADPLHPASPPSPEASVRGCCLPIAPANTVVPPPTIEVTFFARRRWVREHPGGVFPMIRRCGKSLRGTRVELSGAELGVSLFPTSNVRGDTTVKEYGLTPVFSLVVPTSLARRVPRLRTRKKTHIYIHSLCIKI